MTGKLILLTNHPERSEGCFVGKTGRGMDRFHFFLKRSLRYENDDEKTKNETIVFKNNRFLMEIVFKKRSFSKRLF